MMCVNLVHEYNFTFCCAEPSVQDFSAFFVDFPRVYFTLHQTVSKFLKAVLKLTFT